jgi:putative transposase
VLGEHEAGGKTVDLARKHGVSKATLYNRRRSSAGWKSKAKRLRHLRDENAKPKKLLAEQMLDAAALRELFYKMVGPVTKRSCCPPAARHGAAGAVGLPHRQRRPQDGSLPVLPAAGHRTTRPIARAWQSSQAVRLSPAVRVLRHQGMPPRRNRIFGLN